MSPPPAAPPPDAVPDSRILLARLVLWWEALLPLLWPSLVIFLLLLILALSDWLAHLPPLLHALLLLAGGLGMLGGLFRLRRLQRPGLMAVRRRLEQDNNLLHHPLRTLGDTQAIGLHSSRSRTLWSAEQERLSAGLGPLRVRRPRAVLHPHDPLLLRLFLPMAVLILAMVAGQEIPARLERAVTLPLDDLLGPPAVTQGWIRPPEFTHQPDLYLSGLPPGAQVTVPEGSRLILQAQGGWGRVQMGLDGVWQDFTDLGAASRHFETLLDKDGHLEIRQGYHLLGSWRLTLLRRTPPLIRLLPEISHDPQGRLRLSWSALDNFGLRRVWLDVRPATDSDTEDSAASTQVPLPWSDGHDDRPHMAWLDLTGNRLAGQMVVLTPHAENIAGLNSAGAPVRLVLPERQFRHPVAAAVAAQRRAVLRDPYSREPVARALLRLQQTPASYRGDLVVHLALNVAAQRLRLDDSEDMIAGLAELLWQTALRIEEDGRSQALNRIEALQQSLQQLTAGQPGDQSARQILSGLRAALTDILRTLPQGDTPLTEQEIREAAETSGAETLDLNDLNTLAQQALAAAARGDQATAQAKLEELRQSIARLQQALASPPSAEMLTRARQRQQALQALRDGQQSLLTDSFRLQQRLAPPPPDGDAAAAGAGAGAAAGAGEMTDPLLRSLPVSPLSARRPPAPPEHKSHAGDDAAAAALARRQDQLHQTLRTVMGQFAPLPLPDALHGADRAMDMSTEHLQRHDLTPALVTEQYALDQLDQALAAAKAEMRKRLGLILLGGGLRSTPEQNGLLPEGEGGVGDTAPPAGQMTIPAPGANGAGGLQQVLDIIRSRLAQPDLPEAERLYYQRLLQPAQ